MRLDLHTHSRHSPDSRLEPVEILKVARQRGLDGVAITDHNAVAGSREAWEYARANRFVVVRGIEVSTSEGHVLAYGVAEALPRDRPPLETVEAVLALGGVPVAAHPYRFWSGLGEAATLSAPFVAHEAQNARTSRRGNARAHALAARKGVPGTGGSDAHFADEIGGAFTVFEDASTEEEALEALRKGRVRTEGRNRDARATARYVTKAVSEWLRRGMRRI